MHWKIGKESDIETKTRWYKHEPITFTERDSVTILWDMPICPDRTIAGHKKDKTCLLIDAAIPLRHHERLRGCGGSKQQLFQLLWKHLAP